MKFVHSFWKGPNGGNNEKWETYLWCAGLSVECIHKNGYKIDLYCDKESYKDFSLIPYDKIHIIEIPKDVNPMFFACCKFVALKEMELGDIHIDMDVFIKDGRLCREIAEFNTDLVVQNVDSEEICNNDPNRKARSFLKDVEMKYGMKVGTKKTFNTGVIGIRNQRLKDMYLDQYFDLLEKSKSLYPFSGVIPDLVLEQDNLYLLTIGWGFTNTTIYDLRGEELFDSEGVPKYEHLLSLEKYKRKEDIKKELKKRNPRVWERINKRIKYNIWT